MRQNPKKNPDARRQRQKNNVKLIPYAFKFVKKFRSRCGFPKVENQAARINKFKLRLSLSSPKSGVRGNFSQLVTNMDLLNRARFALRNGYYEKPWMETV